MEKTEVPMVATADACSSRRHRSRCRCRSTTARSTGSPPTRHRSRICLYAHTPTSRTPCHCWSCTAPFVHYRKRRMAWTCAAADVAGMHRRAGLGVVVIALPPSLRARCKFGDQNLRNHKNCEPKGCQRALHGTLRAPSATTRTGGVEAADAPAWHRHLRQPSGKRPFPRVTA